MIVIFLLSSLHFLNFPISDFITSRQEILLWFIKIVNLSQLKINKNIISLLFEL